VIRRGVCITRYSKDILWHLDGLTKSQAMATVCSRKERKGRRSD
jgi:hypothetical protein